MLGGRERGRENLVNCNNGTRPASSVIKDAPVGGLKYFTQFRTVRQKLGIPRRKFHEHWNVFEAHAIITVDPIY